MHILVVGIRLFNISGVWTGTLMCLVTNVSKRTQLLHYSTLLLNLKLTFAHVRHSLVLCSLQVYIMSKHT